MEESFHLLGESEDVRIGARTLGGGSAGLEVLVRLCRPGPDLEFDQLRGWLDRLERLRGAGYLLMPQDGWWVVCEKAVAEGELAEEGAYAVGLFADVLSKK